MDPLELNRLIEKAKAEATATGAIEAPHEDVLGGSEEGSTKLASKAEELSAELDKMAEEDEMTEALEKKAKKERASHMYIAKLLTAIDVMSEVS